MHYVIRRAKSPPGFSGDWDSPIWRGADIAPVSSFHASSSDHRPQTQARVLFDDSGIYVMFRAEDRYVVCTRREHQTLTSKDSCVEVFFKPFENKGYFNFEMNCGGSLLLFYVTDPTRVSPGVFAGKEVVSRTLIETMRIAPSITELPRTEIPRPITWSVEFFIPNQLFEAYVGPLGEPSTRRWRGNFFKCAEDSSHPHWASWNPIGCTLNFHSPACFAPMSFG